MSNLNQYGPFQNDEMREDVAAYRNPAPQAPVNHEAFRSEIVDYFTRRQARLKIVKTTTTPRGQIIDWIPIESQVPKGLIATPPPLSDHRDESSQEHKELAAVAELEHGDCERGPSGTVPILRKKLDALG